MTKPTDTQQGAIIMEDKELREILETSLKQAFEYAFNKGIKSDYEPDHDRAKAIRDEALAQIQAHYEAKIVAEKTELLDSLYWMYTQYCSKGHDFMGAGESASEILENADYIVVGTMGEILKDNGDSYEQTLKKEKH